MSRLKQPIAVVTGANGFLGKHLCHLLLKNKWHVYAMCRSVEKFNTLKLAAKPIIADINDVPAMQKGFPDVVDALFHTAASTNTWFKNNKQQNKTNLGGMQNMINLAKQKQVKRFIHTSSVVAFGMHQDNENISEDMEKYGKNSWVNYVRTKAISELYLLDDKDIDAVVLNPTHIIGPGDRNNWVRLIQMIAQNKLPSIPQGSGSFVDVRDVANGLLKAYEQGRKGQNYLLGGHNMSFKTFIDEVAQQLNVQLRAKQLPTALLKMVARSKNLLSRFTHKEPDLTPESVALISDQYSCDSAKAKAELHYRISDFKTTIRDTLCDLHDAKLI